MRQFSKYGDFDFPSGYQTKYKPVPHTMGGGGVIFILHIKIYLLGRTLDSLNPVGHTHMST